MAGAGRAEAWPLEPRMEGAARCVCALCRPSAAGGGPKGPASEAHGVAEKEVAQIHGHALPVAKLDKRDTRASINCSSSLFLLLLPPPRARVSRLSHSHSTKTRFFTPSPGARMSLGPGAVEAAQEGSWDGMRQAA